MAHWRLLSERLGGVGDSVCFTWSELEEVVGSLPPSAARHRAWWSGDRPHVRAWRSAGFSISHLVLGSEVTFSRTKGTAAVHPTSKTHSADSRAAVPREPVRPIGEQPDIVLVACVKTKLSTPAPARDLYVSDLFTKEREYAERTGARWFILSAEHGLVAPDEWLAPYERYLPDTPAAYRAAWGRWIAERLDLLVGPLQGKLVEVHAGSAYLEAVSPLVQSKGAEVLAPLEGLSMGERLQWYGRQASAVAGRLPAEAGADHPDAAAIALRLLDEVSAVAPQVFLAQHSAGLRMPGLYSWWVDPSGADDLAHGLRLSVSPGLVYAGLAGATRWPSGKPSVNTLWSRIAGMHLGGRQEFSTFRRTLAAILSTANNNVDETALTEWMMNHLRVLAVPCEDADSLGRLELEVLTALNPAFNLQGMLATPVRLRISELRKALEA